VSAASCAAALELTCLPSTGWGFFTFSMLAFVYVLWSLVGSARSSAFLRHPKVRALRRCSAPFG
jgi:bacteriorhodopsin